MDDKEPEILWDDFTVEITDLDQSSGKKRPGWPRLTPRQRKLSVAATVALFVLVVSLLLSSASDVRSLLGRAFPQPTSAPSPSLMAGPLFVYLRGNPTWGHFTLDGKVLTHVPVVGRDQPLPLAHGSHTIIWQAEPFKPKTCEFTVIDALTVKGPCFSASSTTANFEPGIKAMVIAFFAALNDLPPEQRVALTQQLQMQFANHNSSTQVQPGELYAISEQEAQTNPSLCKPFQGLALCYAQAEQPLTATLNLQIDTLTSHDDPCVLSGQCDIYHQDCRMLCDDPVLDYSQPGIEGWSVIAMIRLLWSYRTLAGQVVASAQPNSALRGSQLYQSVSIYLERNAQNGWHITLFPTYGSAGFAAGNPVCAQATGDTMSALNASFDNNANMYVRQSFADPAQMAFGCLTIAIQPELQFTATPTPTPNEDTIPPATFLLRFGVLLTVNASARKVCPGLPAADAHEEQLAQRLQTSFSTST